MTAEARSVKIDGRRFRIMEPGIHQLGSDGKVRDARTGETLKGPWVDPEKAAQALDRQKKAASKRKAAKKTGARKGAKR